jgi:hypothetical protein
MPDPQLTYDSWLIELDPQEQNRRKLFGEPEPLPQHVLDADKTHDEPSLPPATEPSSVTTDSRATGKKPVATGTVSSEHVDQPPDEEQPDLYDGNVPRDSIPELKPKSVSTLPSSRKKEVKRARREFVSGVMAEIRGNYFRS